MRENVYPDFVNATDTHLLNQCVPFHLIKNRETDLRIGIGNKDIHQNCFAFFYGLM